MSSPIVTCPNCGSRNRVPTEKLAQGKTPRCGKCNTPLPPSEGVVEVTDANFAALVERAPLPVLIDFWAPWCGPCRMVAPIVEEIAAEFAGRARVGKLNVDENPRAAKRYQVQAIPTLILFKGGGVAERLLGVQPKEVIRQHLERLLP